MARWDHGYVTDVVYVNGVHRECLPSWLACASLLLGHRPPELSAPFRYADLGCGNGYTVLNAAAASPQAEFWGFDFNPAHIESARGVAARAGLRNVRFVEASFAELAALPQAALPEFDFVVAHGVLSWVSAENRQELTRVIGQRLRPGGLAYVSYNVGVGWAAMVPLRALMLLLLEDSGARSDEAAPEILESIERIRNAGALFFQANPSVERRLKDMGQQNRRYLAHEFLNRDWHPFSFRDISVQMAEAKCSYIGSATLIENIDGASLPPGMVPLLSEANGQAVREMLRDFASGQTFRRDLYRRGLLPLTRQEHEAQVDALTIAPIGATIPDPVTFNAQIGSMTGNPELYRPLVARLAQGPLAIRELRLIQPFASRPISESLQAVAMMISGNYAHPVLPGGDSDAARRSVRALNRVTAEINGQGGDLPRLLAPLIGSVLPAEVIETLLFGALLDGRPAEREALARDIPGLLARSDRTLQQDGKPVTDPAAMHAIATEIADRFVNQRLPVLRALGVLDG